MDVDAIVRRRPEVVLVDEFAHTQRARAARNAKRWQDANDILDAGIDVISTVRHPAPRIAQRRRRADHRRPAARDGARRRGACAPIRSSSSTCRPRHCGGGWPTATSTPPTRSTPRSATTSGRATSPRCVSWPCCGSPTASTTRWTSTAAATASAGRGETRERVVVAVSGAPNGENLIRRAAALAQRTKGELIGVHVHERVRPRRWR